MRAAHITQTGPPDVIRYGELPSPEPAASQVLVRVEAVSVNPIDTYIRSGLVPSIKSFPYIVGADFAGIVEAVGPEIRGFKPGDRVWSCNQGQAGRQGVFSEFAVIEEAWVYPLPAGVDPKSATACGLTGITAHLGLFREAGLQPGETVFVNGGTGGVGSMVVQMAKLRGARVIASAGSAEKGARCRELGADEVVLYKTEDLAARVRALAPQGIHVWYETTREPNLERSVPLMSLGGRMVIMAGRDARPTLHIGAFYPRDCKLLGFAMFNAPADAQAESARELADWLATGKLQPQIDRVMQLSETAEAHRIQEENTIKGAGTLTGKIVLVP